MLDGKAPETLLDSYTFEREHGADENILQSSRSTDFITPKSDMSRIFRDADLDLSEHNEFARPLVNSGRLSVPCIYDGSPLNGPDAAMLPKRTRPGSPAVDAPLDDDWLLQKLGGGFVLLGLGFDITATRGTAAWLTENGIACETVNKVYEGGLTIVDRLKDGHIALVFNTTEGAQAVEDSRDIRAVALYDKIPYFTTAAAAHAAVLAMQARVEGDVGVRSLQG